MVLKVDEKTPIAALELAAILRDAGLPAGAFHVITGPGETVGAHLVRHPDVRKVSFTGLRRTRSDTRRIRIRRRYRTAVPPRPRAGWMSRVAALSFGGMRSGSWREVDRFHGAK
ncbi:aldehyde dehydrogenase family protein [Embleya sp. NPDC005971]|uniref:aldehyde dehydrogenase family protein n=1 Tax=Embleya sp. NPDC005971 TaxID=3156724 RepID=UPI0033F051C1